MVKLSTCGATGPGFDSLSTISEIDLIKSDNCIHVHVVTYYKGTQLCHESFCLRCIK